MMADQNAPCTCGSGKQAGACHAAHDTCHCGSGKPAGHRHFADQHTHKDEAHAH
jgi:hypothetical protein